MNKRILKLLGDAGFHQPEMERHELDPKFEKFAELIVQECCDKIEREYKYALGEKTQWAMSQDVQDLLKEHFGIE